MKKFLPFILVLALLGGASYYLFKDDVQSKVASAKADTFKIESFNRVRGCSILPRFLVKAGITRPIIDLSQMQYKGIAFYYGANFRQVLHKKQWEQFDALGTYAIDRFGNIYLTPNPFISIKPDTFNLQKAIYKMDKDSGKLSRWMVIDSVKPNAQNPYGLISVLYDCKDGTLWASAIDKSDYKGSKGSIYHINPKSKEILSQIDGFDALTLAWLNGEKNRYLLAGNARDNGVYAFSFKDDKVQKNPHKLFELPNPRLRVRKIKVIGKNTLKVEAIKFNYSLIAETNKKQRTDYIVEYHSKNNSWNLRRK